MEISCPNDGVEDPFVRSVPEFAAPVSRRPDLEVASQFSANPVREAYRAGRRPNCSDLPEVERSDERHRAVKGDECQHSPGRDRR